MCLSSIKMSNSLQQQYYYKSKKTKTAREVAIITLQKIEEGKPVQLILNDILLIHPLSKQDAALATELVYGYLRLELRILWVLDQFLKKAQKLPPEMKLTLGLATYELLFLDRVPPYASIHIAVSTIKSKFGKILAGVANATLQNILRESKHIDGPKHNNFYKKRLSEDNQYFSIYYSIPLWIIKLWTSNYGKQKTLKLVTSSIQRPYLCIRVNPAYNKWKEIYAILCQNGGIPIGRSGIYFKPNNKPEILQYYLKQGYISIHGAGSQLIMDALNIQEWKTPIWDVCAGRGGKTLLLLEWKIPIFAASDISLNKLQGLAIEAKRLKLQPPPIFCSSATHWVLNTSIKKVISPNLQPYTMLLDVPCSGLGTLSRHPDIKKFRTPKQTENLIRLQTKILNTAWEQLPLYGELIYITCTVNPLENEQQISQLLKTHPQASLKKQWEGTPDCLGTDIMFGAIIQKTIV